LARRFHRPQIVIFYPLLPSSCTTYPQNPLLT
jgi:hypothetical protein